MNMHSVYACHIRMRLRSSVSQAGTGYVRATLTTVAFSARFDWPSPLHCGWLTLDVLFVYPNYREN